MKEIEDLSKELIDKMGLPGEGCEWYLKDISRNEPTLSHGRGFYVRILSRPIIQVISPSDILSSVDVELSSAPEQDDWHVFGGGSVLLNQNLKYSPFRMNLNFSSARIRQDHTFGHRGGDQPVPNGILVEFSGTFKRKEWCSFEGDAKNITWTDIIGSYTVLGTCDGYRYEHEDKSTSIPDVVFTKDGEAIG